MIHLNLFCCTSQQAWELNSSADQKWYKTMPKWFSQTINNPPYAALFVIFLDVFSCHLFTLVHFSVGCLHNGNLGNVTFLWCSINVLKNKFPSSKQGDQICPWIKHPDIQNDSHQQQPESSSPGDVTHGRPAMTLTRELAHLYDRFKGPSLDPKMAQTGLIHLSSTPLEF